jgi:hypothetical protein
MKLLRGAKSEHPCQTPEAVFERIILATSNASPRHPPDATAAAWTNAPPHVLLRVKGKVMLSGYANDLYDTMLSGWARHTFEMANHASGSRRKRKMTDVLWCNF